MKYELVLTRCGYAMNSEFFMWVLVKMCGHTLREANALLEEFAKSGSVVILQTDDKIKIDILKETVDANYSLASVAAREATGAV